MLAVAVVVAAGALLDLAAPAPAASVALSPAGRLFSALGEAREWVADWGWLKANVAWERRDAATVRAWLATVRAASPGRGYFRRNSARMLAYDLPAWRVEAEPTAPAGARLRWRQLGAEEALAWLAPEEHDDAGTWIEAGAISLYALQDRERAIRCFGRAAALPDAPWHAGRIHAQLLVESGRLREAAGFLRRWVPSLPTGEPAAQRALMEERLAALERQLESEGF